MNEKINIMKYFERCIRKELNMSNQASIRVETMEISKKKHSDFKRESHAKIVQNTLKITPNLTLTSH